MVKYFSFAGNNGSTNHLYMWGSSHADYCMKKYNNLYLYCQKGWEALNFKLSSIFFNTQTKVVVELLKHKSKHVLNRLEDS